MNVDHILETLNEAGVDYLLIGGMNFVLNHRPELTFDVDVWVRDEDNNLGRLNQALRNLEASWGASETTWNPVPENPAWLKTQSLFCLTSSSGALDIFRQVLGLDNRLEECRKSAAAKTTGSGVPYLSLSDRHMLECQPALPSAEQKQARIQVLVEAIDSLKKSLQDGGISATDKNREEAKRDKAWDARERWLAIQKTIAWAESQLPPAQRRNRPRRPLSLEGIQT